MRLAEVKIIKRGWQIYRQSKIKETPFLILIAF